MAASPCLPPLGPFRNAFVSEDDSGLPRASGDNMTTHRLMKVVSVVVAIGSAVMAAGWVVIAFSGGRMPVIGYDTEGGALTGVLWLFVIAPVGATFVLCWASLIL